MIAAESRLCWDIIKCPHSCPIQCKSIVSIQATNIWQIPEPWNGSLTSDFLLIAGNPALDNDELYPSTSSFSSLSWVGPGVWNDVIVESFFEGRYGISTNPAFPGRKYVDVLTNPPSILLKNGSIKNAKNPYWAVANTICSVLNDSFVPWSFAFTDIVHCKSSSSQGNPPFNICRCHTKDIIDMFVNMSKASVPTVILIGAPANKQKDYFFGKTSISCNNQFGEYDLKRKKKVYKKIISEEVFKMGERNVRVISGIPAPSTANRQVSNVRIGRTVIW